MTGALLLLLALAQATTSPPGPDSLRGLALHGSDDVLRASVRDAPAQARDAVSLLLATAVQPDSAGVRSLLAAERLATAILMQLGDSFPQRQVQRYAGWTTAERRQKVVIDSLRRAGNAAMGRAGFARARVLWQASARRARALHDSAGVAAALGNIGTGYYRAGELDSAMTYYTRAGALAGAVGDRRTALNALGGSASVALERGDLRVAQQLFDSALALRATIGDVRGMAADRNNIGALNERMGDVASAREAYLAALALAEQYGMDEPAAVSLLNLGKLASLRAEFAEADQRYAAAQAHYVSAANRPGEAQVYEQLGQVGMRRGDYAGAARRFRSALAIYRETGPASSVAELRAQLARALAAAGALDQARVELDRARSELAGAPESRTTALVELTAADLAVEFNSYDAAEASYRKAESGYREAGDAAGRAQARQGLAYLQLLRSEPAAAAATLEPVVAALDLAGAHRDAALARVDLAFAYASAGRTIRARAVLAVARDSLRQGGDVVGEAAVLDAMGDLERGDGRPVAAMALYERGLQVLGGRQAPNVEWQLRAGLAEAMSDQKAPAAAVISMRQAVTVLDGTALRIPAEQRRSRYLADKWYAYDRLARLEAQLGRDSTAFEVSERMRAREMRDALARGRIPWRADADSALVREEQELRHAITELAAEVDGSASGNSALRGPSSAPSTPGRTQEALAQAETRYAELLTTLRDRQPAYARLVAGPAARWQEIAGALSLDAALIEYLVSDSAAMVFVVTRSGVRTIELATDRTELAPLIDFARGAIAATRNPGAAPNFRAPLQALHGMLIGPVEGIGCAARHPFARHRAAGGTALPAIRRAARAGDQGSLPGGEVRPVGGAVGVDLVAAAAADTTDAAHTGAGPRARAAGTPRVGDGSDGHPHGHGKRCDGASGRGGIARQPRGSCLELRHPALRDLRGAQPAEPAALVPGARSQGGRRPAPGGGCVRNVTRCTSCSVERLPDGNRFRDAGGRAGRGRVGLALAVVPDGGCAKCPGDAVAG